jgi:cell fate regulator YaaT (PSP1 superfamily)
VLGQYWVRFGVMGTVARMATAEAQSFARGARVVCRTPRGLEVGEVLSPVDKSATFDAGGSQAAKPPLGTVLRRMSVEDDLLHSRIEKHKHEAFEACERQLIERGIPAVLLDAEHLFDGQSLLFYFLGETTPELDELTRELGETYDAHVQFSKFAETLTTGCGPGCGTAEAEGSGCGSGGCSTCAVLSACGTKKR